MLSGCCQSVFGAFGIDVCMSTCEWVAMRIDVIECVCLSVWGLD